MTEKTLAEAVCPIKPAHKFVLATKYGWAVPIVLVFSWRWPCSPPCALAPIRYHGHIPSGWFCACSGHSMPLTALVGICGRRPL